jgi:hypothetical protein
LFVKSSAQNIRQTLVRQKLAEEFPVPSESKAIRLGMLKTSKRLKVDGNMIYGRIMPDTAEAPKADPYIYFSSAAIIP